MKGEFNSTNLEAIRARWFYFSAFCNSFFPCRSRRTAMYIIPRDSLREEETRIALGNKSEIPNYIAII